jgi:SAM-dependent methyltransferase
MLDNAAYVNLLLVDSSGARIPAVADVGDPHQRARERWRASRPNRGLTWGREITGDAFVAKAESYGAFGSDKAILEIGPGYGRLLRACLGREVPFEKYVAVDISPMNVKYLTSEFERGDVEVILGDMETMALEQRFDVTLSSLTLKHMYPSFEAVLRNVERHLNPGAIVLFDLIEGEFQGFPPGNNPNPGNPLVRGNTYIHEYSRAEVEGILSAVSLELVAFDEVEHDPEQVRLLVVARKPSGE